MRQKINFNGGPAAMPPEVLYEASRAVRKYEDTGMSILELPHRSKEFLDIIEESKSLVRQLCGIGSDYEVIWLQGGGRMQFCMLPMNFMGDGDSAGYLDTGHWAADAMEYATHYGDVQILASSRNTGYDHLPDWPAAIPEQLSYLHITTNNTIYGTQWHHIPRTEVPLVADMSSDIFSAKHDYRKYALFYAAAQKNLGAAGTTLVVVRKDMLERTARELPPMLSYKAHCKENSILNTANVFGIYVSLLTLRWINNRGIAAIEKENKSKARLLYDVLDHSRIFKAHVSVKAHRSLMNVCFTAADPKLESDFLALCDEHNITGIKGHRSVGGFRVSLYNAVSLASVEMLTGLMRDFEAMHAQ